jgi:hypothetical protein
MSTFRWLSMAAVVVTLVGCVTSSGLGPQGESSLSSSKEVGSSAKNQKDQNELQNLPDIEKSGSVFQVRGNVARQVYQQLASVGQRSHEGGQEVVKFIGDLEISCSRSGGVLPAGTRGFPPPVDYECQIRGNSTSQDGKASDQKEVVFLKNGSAKRFFGALSATPQQSEDRVSKSIRGQMVIVCKGAALPRDGAKCEAERTVAH